MYRDLSTSSERFLKAVNWLENELKFDEGKLKDEIRRIEEELRKMPKTMKIRPGEKIQVFPSKKSDLEHKIENLNKTLELKYRCGYAEAFYIFKKVM